MSSFSASTQMSLPRAKIDTIAYILRQANAHFSQVAAECRKSFQPTRHARKHAYSLNLSISIQAASKLDQRHISAIPLPILDLAPSPVSQVAQESQVPIEAPVITVTEVDAPLPSMFAPVPRYPSNTLRVKEVKRPAKPILHCVIPTKPDIVDVPENVISSGSMYSSVSTRSRRGLTSRWSASTADDVEAEDDEMPEADVPEPVQVRVKYSSVYDGSLDILVSPDGIQELEAFASLRPRIAVSGSARARISFPPVACDFQFGLQPQHKAARSTRIPRQASPQLVEFDLARQALSSGSDSSQSSESSVDVITPVSVPPLPFFECKLTVLCDALAHIGAAQADDSH